MKPLAEYSIVELQSLDAGPATDRLVAEALGHVDRRFDGEKVVDVALAYSTEISAAWPLVERFPHFEVTFVDFERSALIRDDHGYSSVGIAPTIPLAITRAFLAHRAIVAEMRRGA